MMLESKWKGVYKAAGSEDMIAVAVTYRKLDKAERQPGCREFRKVLGT